MAERFDSEQQELRVTTPDEPVASPEREAEQRLGKSMLGKLALVAVIVASLVISITCVMRANQLKAQADEIKTEIDDVKQKIAQLKYFINKEVDDEYIIEYAREYLDMYFPDEEIYYSDVNE